MPAATAAPPVRACFDATVSPSQASPPPHPSQRGAGLSPGQKATIAINLSAESEGAHWPHLWTRSHSRPGACQTLGNTVLPPVEPAAGPARTPAPGPTGFTAGTRAHRVPRCLIKDGALGQGLHVCPEGFTFLQGISFLGNYENTMHCASALVLASAVCFFLLARHLAFRLASALRRPFSFASAAVLACRISHKSRQAPSCPYCCPEAFPAASKASFFRAARPCFFFLFSSRLCLRRVFKAFCAFAASSSRFLFAVLAAAFAAAFCRLSSCRFCLRLLVSGSARPALHTSAVGVFCKRAQPWPRTPPVDSGATSP